MRPKLIRWLPVAGWMIIIFIGSSIGSVPQLNERAADDLLHVAGHVIEYAVLGWLLARALAQGQSPSRRMLVITLMGVLLYGVSDEFHQRFTPGRNSDLIALVWDGLGGLIGVACQRIRHRSTNRQRMDNG